MKRLRRFLIPGVVVATALALILSQALPGPSAPAVAMGNPSSTEPPTDQIIVKYRSTSFTPNAQPSAPAVMQRLSDAAGAPLVYVRAMSEAVHIVSLPERRSLTEVTAIANRLALLPDIDYAEPDALLQHTLTPNDPQYANQWHYFGTYGIDAPGAWDVTTGASNIVVAVIDTGITNHADLSGRTVPGYDFITDLAVANDGNGRDSDPSDPGDWTVANYCYSGSAAQNSSWHGTHVAGTIGAASNNSLGVAGINWVSRILPVRVLGRCGGFTSDILDGMRWAAGLSVAGVPSNPNPAKVLNLSLGGSGACGVTQQSVINEITTAGATIVVSAGNSNANASGYNPASCDNVITVAATNATGQRSYYSNYGSVVDIAAPGGEKNVSLSEGVLSTLNTGLTVPAADTYAYYQGTSMAAPHVSGVASLLYSLNPSLTPAQVKQTLQNTVKPFPGGSTCTTLICGTGIVNASNAVSAPDVTIQKAAILGRTFTPGDRITYTLTIANLGSQTANGVRVTDTLPASLVAPMSFASSLVITSADGANYAWTVAPLAGGASGVITVYAQISASLPITAVVVNTAVVSDPQDHDLTNNSSTTFAGGYKVYLPLVLRSYGPPAGIYGHVTAGGAAASGVSLDLRLWNGSGWSTVNTTATDSNGNYVFAGAATLTAGQSYYVRYLNGQTNNSRLSYWSTRQLSTYAVGSSVNIGDFDLTNIALSAPAGGVTLTLPINFLWQVRTATTGDNYEVDFFNPSDNTTYGWTPQLGYVGSYWLNALPVNQGSGPAFTSGPRYGWYMAVYSPDNGYGESYYYRPIAFSGAAAAGAQQPLAIRPRDPERLPPLADPTP